MPGSGLDAIAQRYASATGAQAMFLLEGAGGLFAAKWRLPRHCVESLWAPHHVLGYRASGIATIRRRSGGIELRKVPVIGSVTFSPGDQPAEWSSDSPVEAIHVYIAAGALQRFADENLGSANAPRIRDFFGVTDPWLSGYFQLLDAECALYEQAGGEDRHRPADSLFLDQTEHLLLRHLVRHHSDAAQAVARAARTHVVPLQRGVTRRIEGYIDANLATDVSLHTLAGVAHMSVDHFLRAFRAATGRTPHRFVLDQRLARAAAMLKAGGASITEIARGCGFRSAAHFSVRFHARFGVTPSQYRRTS